MQAKDTKPLIPSLHPSFIHDWIPLKQPLPEQPCVNFMNQQALALHPWLNLNPNQSSCLNFQNMYHHTWTTLFFPVEETEPKAVYMLGKCSTSNLTY